MVISRLCFVLSLIIGVFIIHQVCPDKIESNSVNEPLEQESSVGKAKEKIVEERSCKQDDEKLVKEESTNEDDATILEDEKEGEQAAKVGEEEEEVRDSYGEGSVCVYCQYCKVCYYGILLYSTIKSCLVIDYSAGFNVCYSRGTLRIFRKVSRTLVKLGYIHFVQISPIGYGK